jgi:hypothetical protein
MERQLQRGQEIAWCDQGYGWAYRQPVNDFFIVAMIAVVLPYVVLRLVPRIGAAFTAVAATRFNRPGDAS